MQGWITTPSGPKMPIWEKWLLGVTSKLHRKFCTQVRHLIYAFSWTVNPIFISHGSFVASELDLAKLLTSKNWQIAKCFKFWIFPYKIHIKQSLASIDVYKAEILLFRSNELCLTVSYRFWGAKRSRCHGNQSENRKIEHFWLKKCKFNHVYTNSSHVVHLQ